MSLPFSLPTASSLSQKRRNDSVLFDSNEKQSGTLDVLNASFLVAGTTIGGGFLALPTVVAPSGFYPSAIALLGVWGYFLAQSFILVECIVNHRSEQMNREDGAWQDGGGGVAAIAKSAFGVKGEVFVGVLLAILIEATLVSQISRAGMMFSNYRFGCLVSALSIALVVFGPNSGVGFASKANAALTSAFLISALTVFGCGLPMADWSNLGNLSSISNNWPSILPAIPTFLQLLVYGEIIPSVCEILNYDTTRIHIAIFLGSFLTLSLQVGWSALGLSLVFRTSTGIDPVNILLANQGSPVRLPLYALAFTAILTTILGSYLALLSTVTDFLSPQESGASNEIAHTYSNSPMHRLKVASLITIPAIGISCTSPSIFLRAIDFAGSYPVLIMWGMMPSAISIVQRIKNQEMGSYNLHRRTGGSSLWVCLLGIVSSIMVGNNIFKDLTTSLSRLMRLGNRGSLNFS